MWSDGDNGGPVTHPGLRPSKKDKLASSQHPFFLFIRSQQHFLNSCYTPELPNRMAGPL